jgi:putative peptidoglycan lipid II flippase
MSKLLAAMVVLGGVLWFASASDSAWLAMSGSQRVLRLAGVVLGGIASYFATLWLLGFRLSDFRRSTA